MSRRPHLRRALARLSITVSVVVVGAVGVVVGALAAGYRPVVITTGSMNPTAPPGSLLIAAPRQADEIAVGDIVVMQAPGTATVTHRVIEIETGGGVPFAITQGDANELPDAAPYALDGPQLVGRWVAPEWGRRLQTVFRPGVSLALVAAATLVFSARALYRIWAPHPARAPAGAPRPKPKPAPGAAGSPRRHRRLLAGLVLPVLALGTTGVAWALFTSGEAVPANQFTTQACFDAQLASVQSGETVHAIDGTVTAPITPVDPAASFLITSVRSSANEPADATVAAVLRADGGAVELIRATDAGVPPPVTVAWSVVAYGCGVSVQRGTVAGDGTNQLDVTVTEVDPGSSFVLATVAAGATDTELDADDLVVASLTSSTNLRLQTAGAGPMPAEQTMAWQVVTFTDPGDASVQTVTGTLGAGATATTLTIPTPVDPGSTFLIAGGTSANTGPDIGDRLLKATLTGPTTIEIERGLAGDPIGVSVQVVTLLDGTTVRHGTVDLAPTETTATAPVEPVDPTRTSVLSTVAHPGAAAGGLTDHPADDVAGEASATFALTSPETVDITRGPAASNASFAWQVIEWAGPRWWDTDYQFRQRIDVDTTTQAAPGGYTTSLTFDHAALVAAGVAAADGSDLRVTRWDGSAWVELDRILDEGSAWNTATTTVWFQTADPIPTNETATFWLYLSNPSPAPPRDDPENVYLLYETFEGGTLGDFEDRTAGGAWYQADPWTRRIPLTVASALVPADATNYPLRVAVTSADMAANAQPDGSDLRFTAADGTTPLDHEIEDWDAATGSVVAWVRIPSLPSTVDTSLYLYYGAPNAPDQQRVRSTWDPGFDGVWHLDRDPTGPAPHLADASRGGHEGLTEGAMTGADLVAGLAGDALAFDGVNDRGELGPVSVGVGGALTVGAWIQPASVATPASVVARGDGVDLVFDLGLVPDTATTAQVQAQVRVGGATVTATGPTTVSTGAWHHIAATYDGTDLVVLVDGIPGLTTTTSGPVDQVNAGTAIGARTGGVAPFDGTIDEVRLATVARPAAWIQTQVANLTAAGFVTIGPPEAGSWLGQGPWAHRKPITIDPSVTDTELTGFAVLVQATDPQIQAAAQATGADLVFTAADGVTRLDHVTEAYNGTSGSFSSWVSVPTLSQESVTEMFVYYGNPSASDQQDPVGVFGTNADLAILGSR